MGYKIIFAPQAVEQLEEIVRYIARDNPNAAEKFGLHLVDQTRLLADFPELGQCYRARANIRQLWCKPYFIYYRVRHDHRIVEIMDYWHSARREPGF
jgi:toxin ParE1/3/4